MFSFFKPKKKVQSVQVNKKDLQSGNSKFILFKIIVFL